MSFDPLGTARLAETIERGINHHVTSDLDVSAILGTISEHVNFPSLLKQLSEKIAATNVSVDHNVTVSEIPALTALAERLDVKKLIDSVLGSSASYMVAFVCGIAYLIRKETVYLVVSASIFGWNALVSLPALASRVFESFKKHEAAEAQFGSEDFAEGVAFLLNLAFKAIGYVIDIQRFRPNILNLACNWKRVKENLMESWDDILTFCSTIINYVSNKILGKPIITLQKLGLPEVDMWRARVHKAVEDFSEGTMPITMDTHDTFLRLHLEGNTLISTNSIYRNDRRVQKCVDEMRREVARIYVSLGQYNFRDNGPRMEPFVITIMGGSGAGKSLLTHPFLRDFLPKVLPAHELDRYKTDPNGFVYARMNEQGFWDGYYAQFVTMFDDFGQADQGLKADNEFFDLIRCSNSFPNCLHMADLVQKGKTVFKSSVILLTTNLKAVHAKGMYSSEAVIRRMGDCYMYAPKPEFSTLETAQLGPYDRKFQPKNDNYEWDPNTHEFWVIRYTTQGYLPAEKIDYEAFLNRCVSRFHNKKSFADQYMTNLHDMTARNVDAAQAQTGLEDPPTEVEIEMQNLDSSDSESYCSENDRSTLSDLREKWSIRLRSTTPPSEDLRVFCRLINFPIENLNRPHMRERALEFVRLFLELAHMPDVASIMTLDPDDISEFLLDYRVEYRFLCHIYQLDPMGKCNALRLLLRKIAGHFGLQFTGKSFLEEISDNHNHMLHHSVLYRACYGFALGYSITMLAQIVTRACVGWLGPRSAQAESDHQSKRYKNKVNFQPRKMTKEERLAHDQHLDSEAQISTQRTCQTVESLIKKSMYSMHFGNNSSPQGYVTFVKGAFMVFPKHYLNAIQGYVLAGDQFSRSSRIVLRGSKIGPEFSISFGDFLDLSFQTDIFENKDLAILRIPGIRRHPDVTGAFLTREEFDKVPDTLMCGYSRLDASGVNAKQIRARRIARQTVRDGDIEYTISGCFIYPISTTKGDCGTLIYSDEARIFPGQILSIHVAGKDVSGISVNLCREDLIEAMDQYVLEFGVAESQIAGIDEFPVGDNFKDIGYLARAIVQPTSTRLRRSALYGSWADPLTAPARLKSFTNADGMVVVPMYKALNKYSVYIPSDHLDLEEIIENMTARLLRCSSPFTWTGKLTHEQAVAGVEGDRFTNGIPRNTSAGWPWIAIPGMDGKKKFWGDDGPYTFTSPLAHQLRQNCDKLHEQIEKEEEPVLYFVDFLKDERRPLHKVEEGSTRLISGAPLELQVVFRQYFQPFISWTMSNRIANGLGPGINYYGCDWNVLALHLLGNGYEMDNILCGDFGNFDGSQTLAIHKAIMDVIQSVCGFSYEETVATDTLFTAVIQSRHICGAKMYRWFSKLPSGTPGTTTINSLYTIMLFFLAWQQLNPDGECVDHDRFWDDIYICAFGDDHIVRVRPACRVWFNGPALQRFFANLGLRYTDAWKGEGAPLFCCLEKASFLKRGFRYSHDAKRYVAPLDISVVLEIPFWVDKAFTTDPVFLGTQVQTSLDELSLHGERVFNQFAPAMIGAYREDTGLTVSRTSYATCFGFITNMQHVLM